jgi:hypothetical protein
MPYNWVRVPSSPPRGRRDDIREICRRHGARLCENQTYYDEDGQAHALIEVRDPEALQGLLEELEATESTALVDADEQDEGVFPPSSQDED